MDKREEDLITSLYTYYVDNKKQTGLKKGDEVIYSKTGSKFYNQKGIFEEIRKEDGRYKIRFDKIIFFAYPQYVEKIKKDDADNINRLIKILKQMVADGDLTQIAVTEFLKGINREKKLKEIDPFGEENWEEEEKTFFPRRMARPRARNVDPPVGGGGGWRGC